MLPAILLLHAKVKPVDTTNDDMTGALQFDSCQALTPETEETTHYFFMQAHKFKQDDATVTESIYQSLCTAFEEDKRIIEAQQKMLKLPAPSPMLMIIADKALVQFRRMLEQMYTEENATANPR